MAEQVTAQRPVILTANCIIGGAFFPAGNELPFKDEGEVPISLKPFIATAEAPAPEPVQRNIYGPPPLAIKRQLHRLEKGIALQEAAEAEASEPLRRNLAAALEAEHDTAIGAAKAQARFNQDVIDAAHAAAQAPEPLQRYVKRGGAWGRVQNSKLKPGEHVFVKRENGEYETVGVVDATGGLPPEEIIT